MSSSAADVSFLARLRAIVGAHHVLTDPDLRASYEIDWTRRFYGSSLAVVRPASTDEVAAVVEVSGEAGVPIVPQGGNTGLVGGGIPQGNDVVLSTRRLDRVRDLDLEAGQVTVEAGVTLAQLAAACVGSGWEFGVDLGARNEATIGGMIATNAGGTRVLRYGMMRHNVLGVEAVLADGSMVSHLNGLIKDNTGYDLAGLLCGSEGTLGIVTAARLRLVPTWPDRWCVAIACEDWAAALALAGRFRREVEGLDGLEAVDAAGQRIAAEHLGLRLPFGEPVPVMLLAVWAGRGDPPDAFAELLADTRHVVATDNAAWEVRERQAEAIARVGIPHKMDVTIPLGRLAQFCDDVLVAVDGEVFLFGHLGDGNLHVNVVGPDPADHAVDEQVLRLVAHSGGSISAEHGVGRLKAKYLGLVRSPAELAAFRSIKSALDPTGVLRPGF